MCGKPRFYRFRELHRDALQVEYQMHTKWTDGASSVREMLLAAAEKGLTAVAFTEHIRRDSGWFAEFVREVREEGAAFPELAVYAGCEAKALDACGSLDASDEALLACDLVLGSVHSFPTALLDGRTMDQLDESTFAQMELTLSLGLLRYGRIDVLAHPGGMTNRRFGGFPVHGYELLMRESLVRGIAMEINPTYLNGPGLYLALAQRINPFVSIGSDAHDTVQIGACRDMLAAYFKSLQ
ncbi:MAG: PHP domain-containing protein [Paenibacillaceae bacterium]|nr:PHP domain-containing protein [Paenibacillaceae bacterium]